MSAKTITVGGITFGEHSYLRGAWEDADGVRVLLYDSAQRRDRDIIMPRADADALCDYFWRLHGPGATHCPAGN